MTTPGLDLDALRALRRLPHDLDRIRSRIGDHLAAHDGYLAFSGGKDSLAVLHLALQVEPDVPVVFFDSGLEYPETYDYLDAVQHLWQVNLTIMPASTPLLELLVTDGSWDHKAAEFRTPDLSQSLIADPARHAHHLFGPGELWGVRAAESMGRRAAYGKALRTEAGNCRCCPNQQAKRASHGGLIRRADRSVAFGPTWDWSDDQVWLYICRNELPVNPVYAKLRALGVEQRSLRITHLIDAGQLQYGRAVWLKAGWPDLFERLRQALPRLQEFL